VTRGLWIALYIFIIISSLPVFAGNRTVRVGFYDNKPLVFMNRLGTPRGFIVDLMADVAKKEHWDIKYVYGTWKDGLDRLKTGKIDLLVPIAETPERDKVYDFSKEMLFANWGQVYTRKGLNILNITDLANRKIALLKGDVHALAFRRLVKEFHIRCDFVKKDSYEEVLKAIFDKEVHAGVVSRLFGAVTAGEYSVTNSNIIFNPIEIRFAVQKGRNRGLLDRIDRDIRNLKKDDKSVFYTSLTRWTGFYDRERGQIQRIWKYILFGGIILLFLLFMAIIWNLSLKKMVQKKTEELRTTLHSIGDAVIATDKSGRITIMNEVAEQLTGWAMKDAKARPLSDVFRIVNEETREPVEDPVHRVLQEGMIVGLANHTVLIAKDGRKIAIADSGAPIKDENGDVIGVVLVFRDQTVRREMLRKLHESEEKYKKAFELIPDALVISSMDGRYLDINQGFARISGYAREEVIGRTTAELGLWADARDREKMVRDLGKNGVVTGLEADFRGKDGTIMNGLLSAVLIEIKGQPFILSVARDITERKEVVHKLQEKERQTRELADALRHAHKIARLSHWKYYIEGDRLEWFEKSYNIFGIRDDELAQTRQDFLKIIHPDDIEKVSNTFITALKTDGEYKATCRMFRVDTNARIYVEIRYRRFRGKDGKVEGITGTMQDVTEREELFWEIQQKEEMMLAQSRQAAMGEMISMIAHQWRQPLSVISMGVNNMLADIEFETVTQEELMRIAELVLTQTKYLSQTIDDFRNFFKPRKDKEMVFPGDIVHEALAFAGKSLENNAIAIEEDFRVDSPIDTYSRELLQVVITVIQNAKDALVENSVEHGVIRIETYEDGEHVYIKIGDNAGGIPEDIKHRIFEPYFSTKAVTGTGLGLYMARTIVEKHLKGRIWAENTAQGACFFIELPRGGQNEQ